MTITIDLPDTTLAALRADAGTQNRSVETVAAEHLAALYAGSDTSGDALHEGSPQAETNTPHTPTASLFALWASEDATTDPDELARRQQDGDTLLQNLRAHPLAFRRARDASGDTP